MKSSEIPELKQDNSIITTPANCSVCSKEVTITDNSLISLSEDGNPLCDEHDIEQTEIVTVERHYGYPNNNIHPKTGETGWLDDSTVWYEIVDRKSM